MLLYMAPVDEKTDRNFLPIVGHLCDTVIVASLLKQW